jgi:hypothetical protein
VTSVIGLESPLLAVLACLGFSRKNQRSAFSDFCNTICQKQTHAAKTASLRARQARIGKAPLRLGAATDVI